jgi:cephalosporin hydroxylase
MKQTDDRDAFASRNKEFVNAMAKDTQFRQLTQSWYNKADSYEYAYHFTWLGMPIIQYPQDILAMQELIYRVKPDLIIETGVARGGSIIFYASMLHLLNNGGQVIGIDINIRQHNKKAIEEHSMFKYITLIEGSSVDSEVVTKVKNIASKYKNILVVLDSNHTEEHVLAELRYYSPLVKVPSYIVVFDTQIENADDSANVNKPWGRGNNPMSAVEKFLLENSRFKVDQEIEDKLQITECPSGYLRCVD